METFFITTPIYYVNDVPHIGHAYTTIACDILSRYQKINNKDVFFLTGTDEHGQKVEKAAIAQSLNPQEFTDKMSKNFEKLTKYLNCEINDFIRTTESRHKLASQSIWNKLLENSQIYLGNYEGWYSVRDEAFYSESELTKINDKFYAPTGAEVEKIKEESYFFKLSSWENKLLEYYKNNPNSIAPKSRYNEVISFIKGGLKDLSISRTTFKWGVKVPNNENHVMYVWIDALCNYLTSIGYPDLDNKTFKNFWPGFHMVGKDILRFHAVYWPAFLMAAEIDPPKRIFAHGWWTNEGKKISKSVGNVIDPYEIINKYGLDQIRFFLFREVPFGNDGDFSKDAISNRLNADLSNNYGNLVQRITTFCVKNCNSKIKNSSNYTKQDKDLIDFMNCKFDEYNKFMNEEKIDKSIKCVFELLSETNAYIDTEAPWNLKKTNKDRMNDVLFLTLNIIKNSSIMLIPVMPESANKILDILNVNKIERNFDHITISTNDYKINDPKPIFPRID